MNPVDIILHKRDANELSRDELDFLIEGYVRGDIPDYQIASFLMAVYFQGMTPQETANLTEIMRDSGIVLDLSEIDGFKVDKHSTGGVGDKVSLVLAPLVASAGLIVPMISGRSLGHTGGTLDKLESISGFRTDLSVEELKRQLRKTGVALVGQTEDLCPADKKIYALRDATATVSAIPLITASILSKKMAEGIDALVLDVKAGSGAIFESSEKAWELGRMLVQTADLFGLKTVALVSSMTQPLGRAIGNWLETQEAIDTLKGNGPEDLLELTLTLGAQMLILAGQASDLDEGKENLRKLILNGKAFDKFLEIVKAQGGHVGCVEDPSAYPTSEYRYELKSQADGYLGEIRCREIGIISMNLGAGRHKVTDGVDYTAGILLRKKVGEPVGQGETLATAYSNNEAALRNAVGRLQDCFRIVTQKTSSEPLLLGLIEATGEYIWNEKLGKFKKV